MTGRPKITRRQQRSENSDVPLVHSYKRQKDSRNLSLNLQLGMITKHHRRNNACIAMKEVLESLLVASLLQGYQANPVVAV
jgi:hypothetical protein